MPKTRRDNYELMSLATKGVLIGADIVLEDQDGNEVVKTISDYRFHMGTMQIIVEFDDGEGETLSLKRTYIVQIDSSYKDVPVRKKKFKIKRK